MDSQPRTAADEIRRADVAPDASTSAGGPAKRFLHVNLNTRDLGASVAFHSALGRLTNRMQTVPEPAEGAMLGMDGIVVTEAVFLYDHRGPRAATALELLQWLDPPTAGAVYPQPTQPGAHAIALAVPSVRAAATAAGDDRATGSGLVRPGDGAVLVRDPDGIGVELTPATAAEIGDDPAAGIVVGMRISCSDLERSTRWYLAVGFEVMDEPEDTVVPGSMLGLDNRGSVTGRTVRLRLPEDEPPFVIALTQWADPEPGTTYPSAHHAGLYRMALRVENVADAIAAVGERGIGARGPITCPLPGTTIGTLDIAFLADPDGVVVELVERPSRHFRARERSSVP